MAGLLGITPQMIAQAQEQQDLKRANTLGGTGMFSGLAKAGIMANQRLGRGLGGNPQMKQAEDFQRVKQEASAIASPGTAEYFAKVAEGLNQLGYQDVAADAQKKAQELMSAQAKSSLENQETQMDILKKAKDLQKPNMDYGNDLEGEAKALFNKTYEQLTKDEARAVSNSVSQKALEKARNTGSAVAAVLGQKGNQKLAERMGSQIVTDVLEQDTIRQNISRFEALYDKTAARKLLAGGGESLQKVKQLSYQVLGELGWLTPGELDSLETTEAVQAELDKLVFDTLGGLGAQVSDSDRDTIKRALGSLGSSPGALLTVFDNIRTIMIEKDQTLSRRINLANRVIEGGGVGAIAAERGLIKEYENLEPKTPAQTQSPQGIAEAARAELQRRMQQRGQ